VFDFPTTPATGTVVTVPDGSYRVWDSLKWTAAPSAAAIIPPGSYLPLTGGTITPGALNIANGNMMTHSVSPSQAQINYNKPALTLEASTFVGTVTGNVLQINSEFTGTINVGHIASWPGFNAGDVIVSGSGTTWTLANSHPPVPGGASFTASVSALPTGQVGGSTLIIQSAVTGTLAIGQRVVWSGGSDIIVNNPVDPVTAQFTGSISGTALTITTLNSGAITIGDIVHWTDNSVPPVAFTNTIVSGSGLSWTLVNNAGTVTSRAMTTNSNTWSLLGSYDNDVPSQAMTSYSVIKTNNRASFSPIVTLPVLSGTIPFGGIASNSPAGLSLGAGSDNIAISSNFPLNFIDIQSVNNGSNFNGGRYGMNILMAVQNTPFTYTNPAFTLGGFYVRATAAIGSTNGADGRGNGVGSVFGGLLTASMGKAAGFWRSNVGLEVDVNVIGPAQAERIAGIQVVHQSGHSKQGLISDIAIGLGDQGRVTAGWRIGYSIGGANSQWPIDPNGLLFRAGYAKATPWTLALPGAAAAGGFDVQQVDFTGMSDVGGGFAFRADGAQIIPSLGNPGGSFIAGAAEFSGTSDGAKIDTTYQQMTGTPAVATGGSLWGVGDTLIDQYGNILQVATITGDAIATVSVVRRGWQKSSPANPVAFNQLTPAAASSQNRTGTGATFNLTWAVPGTTLHLQPSGGAITSPLLTNATNDAAAASAGVAVGQWYRNGSIMMQRVA
jgi:hypothetical protein